MFHTRKTRIAQLAEFLRMFAITAISVFGLMAMFVFFS